MERKMNKFVKYFGIVFAVWATGWILGDMICLQQLPWGEKMQAEDLSEKAVMRWIIGVGLPFSVSVLSFLVGGGIGYILLGIYKFLRFLACKWVGKKDCKASAFNQ